MVKVKEDMTGWVISEHGIPDSRLTVIKQAEDYINPTTGKRHAQWVCVCNCKQHKSIIARGGRYKKWKSKILWVFTKRNNKKHRKTK